MTKEKSWFNDDRKLTKKQAIGLIDKATNKDDPYWEWVVEDYYDEDTDSWPTIYHIFAALGVTESEYKDATGEQGVLWPKIQEAE